MKQSFNNRQKITFNLSNQQLYCLLTYPYFESSVHIILYRYIIIIHSIGPSIHVHITLYIILYGICMYVCIYVCMYVMYDVVCMWGMMLLR